MNDMPRTSQEAPRRLDLHGAYIPRTSWRRTNLTRANFSGADCRFVDFSGSIMREVDLTHTDLSEANLSGADLGNAKLAGACLRGANLTDVINMTAEQLREAVIDDKTILPDYLSPVPAK